MILILLGAVFGSLNGFKAQEIVPKTETFHIQNILSNGQFTTIPKISARVNDFWITYTKQTTVSQFYSDISILNVDGNEIERKTIFVNSPLKHEGVDYYQTDWNLIGLRIQTKAQSTLQYPLVSVLNNRNKVWLTWIPLDSELKTGVTILVDNLQGYASVYNEIGSFLGNLELNENFNSNISIILTDIISSTGLQIKSDPGIPLIYAGFFLLMVSTLISYITYSQIWIIQYNKQIFIGGTTNRATFDFELEFFEFIK
jgi:cytochrome c biogenesis protein